MATGDHSAFVTHRWVSRVLDPDQAPQAASLSVGHRTQQNGLPDSVPPLSAGYRCRRTTSRRCAVHHPHAQVGPGDQLCTLNQHASRVSPVLIHQAQNQPVGEARPRGTIHNSGLGTLLPEPVPETAYSPALIPLSEDDDAAPISTAFELDDFELASPQTNSEARSSTRLYHSPGVPQIDIIPSVGAQHAAFGMPKADALLVDGSHIHKNGVNEPRFVGFGEADPEKHSKRRDCVEDKKRKEDISKWHGACLKCKKTRKRCNGGQVCKRCDKRGYECIRTCRSCWSTKKPACDEGVSCKKCQLAGTICVRPSVSITMTEDQDRLDLAGVPSQAMTTTSSSALVNNHTMSATGRQIPAPTAWNVAFYMTSVPLDKDENGVKGPASDRALHGSTPYSQQSTDVDLHPIFTNSSGTKAASEANSLQVPGKQDVSFDSRSEATGSTSHFDDAMHYSDQDSPQVERLDPYAWSTRETY